VGPPVDDNSGPAAYAVADGQKMLTADDGDGNTDILLNPLMDTASADECGAMCTGSDECKAFSFVNGVCSVFKAEPSVEQGQLFNTFIKLGCDADDGGRLRRQSEGACSVTFHAGLSITYVAANTQSALRMRREEVNNADILLSSGEGVAADDCAKSCDADADCVAFSFISNECSLYNAVPSIGEGQIFNTYTKASCEAMPPACDVMLSTLEEEHATELKQMSAEHEAGLKALQDELDCAKACAGDEECGGFLFEDGVCTNFTSDDIELMQEDLSVDTVVVVRQVVRNNTCRRGRRGRRETPSGTP
jgi:hypothetical protein